MLSLFTFSTPFAAILHIWPMFSPFFTPIKWSLANKAYFNGEIFMND
tara:strand:- start:544 stop:684 length:141 start_codon:yes stop_codon:yes gene_type:complete